MVARQQEVSSMMRKSVVSLGLRVGLWGALVAALVGPAMVLSVRASSAQEGKPGAKRVVLVTGANRGLGLEFARQYHAAGWSVIGTARNVEAATELKAL